MIRLDKYIADAAGLTRREAGKAIRSGAVAVNGTVVRKPERGPLRLAPLPLFPAG